MRTSDRTADPSVRAERMRVIPMRRPGEVDEVAYAILFLASDESPAGIEGVEEGERHQNTPLFFGIAARCAGGCPTARLGFVDDSPLEGDGFEPLVPREKGRRLSRPSDRPPAPSPPRESSDALARGTGSSNPSLHQRVYLSGEMRPLW